MSVCLIGNETINALITVAILNEFVEPACAQDAVEELQNLNIQAFYGRYSERIKPEKYKFKYYEWDLYNPDSWLQIAYLAQYFKYQCCEAADFKTLEAAKVITKMGDEYASLYRHFLTDAHIYHDFTHSNWEKVSVCELPCRSQMYWGFD